MQDVHSGTITRAADWRSGPRWGVKSVLCPVHPLPLRGVPLKGKREVWRGKTGSHIFHVPFRNFPFGGERREPITRMPIMPYDTKSQIRNADFISIARRAIHNPRANGPSNLRTFRTLGTKSRQPSYPTGRVIKI